MRSPFRFKRTPKPKEIMESSFQTILKKAIENEGGTVSIYRYDPEGQAGSFASKIAPFDSDVKDWKDRDVSAYLNQVHGGGRYRVQVNYKRKDGSLVEAKTFDYAIGGEPKEGYYESKKTKQVEQQQVTDIFKTAMEFAKDVKGGDGNTELVKTLMTLNAGLQELNSKNMLELQKHNDTMMMEMQKRNDALMLELRRDKNAGGGITELLDNMMQMKEFESTIQPKFEQNDTVEMIKAIASVAPVIAAWKTGALPQQEQIRMLEATRPGESHIELGAPPPATRGTPSVQKTEATPSEIKLPNGTNVKRDEFEIVMLDPLIDQINAGAPPHQIAIMIKTIIDWTFFRAELGVKPHSSILGMIAALTEASQGKADIAAIEKAYSDFASLIEMPAELIEPVKVELSQIYMPLFMSIQDAKNKEDAGGVEDESPAE